MGEFNIYGEFIDFAPLIELFLEKGQSREYKKGEYFCRVGDRGLYIGYIKEGSFRYTCDGSDGKEHILSYAFDNDFFGNYSSLQNQSPAILNIQAIQKSLIYELSISAVNEFFNSDMHTQYLGRRISEVVLYSTAQRIVSMYCDTPEERYMALTKRCPDILNRITLRELASFIAVTPETLSRIRKKILLNKKS